MRSRFVARTGRHLLLAFLVLISIAPVLPVSAQEGEATAEGPVTIEMIDSAFEPQIVMVKVNQTVAWVNRGQLNHDVTGIGYELVSPRNMASGATFEHKFTEAGVYDYYCTLHSPGRGKAMWGRLVVVEDPVLQFRGEGGPASPEEIGVRWLAHWVGIISFIAVLATLIIYYFVLKYGETVHATDHRERKEK